MLAVRIQKQGLLLTKLYDPYNLYKNVSLEFHNNHYTLTHNFVTSGITKDDSSYSMTSSVQYLAANKAVSVAVQLKLDNSIDFVVKDGSGDDSFTTCDLFFYDFTVY